MKRLPFVLVLVLGTCALAFSASTGPKQPWLRDGCSEPVIVDLGRPVPVISVPEELDRRGYSAPLFRCIQSRVPVIDEYAAGIPPEADCPVAGAITPSGSMAVVAFRLSNNVGIQNLSSFEWTDLVPVGDSPVSIAITPSGEYALIACLDSNCVDVVNLSTFTVDHQIPVGQNPVAVAVAADGSRAITLNSTDSSASVISLSNWTVERTVAGIISGVWTTTWAGSGRWMQEYSELRILADDITAVVPTGPTVEFINMSDGTIYSLAIAQGTAKDIDISRDNTRMAVAGDNSTRDVNFIDISVNPPVVTGGFNLSGHNYWGYDIQFNEDASLLALTQLPTSGGYTYLSFFNTTTYEQNLYINNGSSCGMALSPDGNAFVSVGYYAIFIDLSGASPVQIGSVTAYTMEFLAESPAAAKVVTGALIRDEVTAVYDYSLAEHNQLYYGSPGMNPESDGPRHISISANGAAAVTADYVSDGSSIINPQTGEVTAIVATGNNAYFTGITPDGTTGIVTNYESASVSILNLAGGALWTTLPSKTRPGNCAVSPDGSRAYVTCVADNPNDFMSVYDLNGASSTHVLDLDLGFNMYGFNNGMWVPNPAVSASGSTVVIPGGNPTPTCKSAVVVDSALLSIQATVSLSSTVGVPFYAAITPDEQRAIILNSTGSGTNTISIIRLLGLASYLEGTLTVPGNPNRVFFSEDNSFAYVSYSYWSPVVRAIAVIDMASRTIVHTVALPGDPSDMAASDGTLYVVCEVNSPTLPKPAIVTVSMAGTSSAITGTYTKDYYSSALAVITGPLTGFTVNSGWDRIGWLHDETTPTPLPVPASSATGSGLMIVVFTVLMVSAPLLFNRKS